MAKSKTALLEYATMGLFGMWSTCSALFVSTA